MTMRLVSNRIMPTDSRATRAETASARAGTLKKNAASAITRATTMPANRKPPMKLKSRRVVST
ncbi:hypothetical protein D9M68_953460 [compost metagenome]